MIVSFILVLLLASKSLCDNNPWIDRYIKLKTVKEDTHVRLCATNVESKEVTCYSSMLQKIKDKRDRQTIIHDCEIFLNSTAPASKLKESWDGHYFCIIHKIYVTRCREMW